MTTTKLALHPTPSALLERMLQAPDLVRQVRALPARSFADLIRRVGLEDAGELVAMASTEQIVSAFDEDLFRSDEAGQREVFDGDRFVTWLEVLLEAGDEKAAARVAQLDEDFLALALASRLVVLDSEALLARLGEGDEDADAIEKVLDGAHSEALDGYMLIVREPEGFDAVMALITALDRDHRAFLARVLDLCANATSGLIEDPDALTDALSAEGALAEEVEADREERRARDGYVEPRDARAFLKLAAQPLGDAEVGGERDAIARAYFRRVDRSKAASPFAAPASDLAAMLRDLDEVDSAQRPAPARGLLGAELPFGEAMRRLGDTDPKLADERLEELAFLANVIAAGVTFDKLRPRPAEAAEAALATVALGAELRVGHAAPRASAEELAEVLRATTADRLFREASAWLVSRALAPRGFLRDRSELPEVLWAG